MKNTAKDTKKSTSGKPKKGVKIIDKPIDYSKYLKDIKKKKG